MLQALGFGCEQLILEAMIGEDPARWASRIVSCPQAWDQVELGFTVLVICRVS